jgi:hypothetical protein
MTKSIRDSKKSKPKIGRPKTTGPGQAQVVRMHDQQIAAIDAWVALQDAEISRPEAIRRLVELGLTVGGKPKQTTAATADRAKELASKAIDSLTGGAPNNDEKASRKRRLIKGPEEFSEVRVDRPKAKGK